jgi:hypothetical protein
MFLICRYCSKAKASDFVVIVGMAETRAAASPMLRSLNKPGSALPHDGHYAVYVENGMFDTEMLRAEMRRQYSIRSRAHAEIRENDPPIVLRFKHPEASSTPAN